MSKAQKQQMMRTIAQVVDRTWSDSAGDLTQACADTGEEAKVHVDDLLDMMCGSGKIPDWELDEVQDEIRAAIKRRCMPDDKGWVWL